jgi:His/Glu/Gln/Arg/opine family amino acid ABC transporter permease subunit
MTTEPLFLIWKSLPLLLQGMIVTIQLFLSASTFSILLGICFGIVTCKKLRIPHLFKVINGVTFTLRAVPFFVQLLIIYFVVPEIFGFNLNPFPASVIALSLCSSGYVAQFIRGGIDEIPSSSWETASTLGYSKKQALFMIVFPQAFRAALPALNNELESLLKSTAIASSIGMLELTRIGMNVVSREMEPVPIYLAIALLYGALSLILNWTTKRLERKFFYVKY